MGCAVVAKRCSETRGGPSKLEEARIYNIVDMGLTFSAMIRLYKKGTKEILHRKILEELKSISYVTSEEGFEIIHSNFCKWGIKTVNH